MQFLNGSAELKMPEIEEKKGKPRSHRESLIEECRIKINQERLGTKFKPLTHVAVKKKVCHLSDFDLGWFVARCNASNSFGKTFFWLLRPEK